MTMEPMGIQQLREFMALSVLQGFVAKNGYRGLTRRLEPDGHALIYCQHVIVCLSSQALLEGPKNLISKPYVVLSTVGL